jgi:hypothetical protein
MLRRREESRQLRQLQQDQGTQYDPDLPDTDAHQLPQILLIFGGHVNTQGWTRHVLVCAKTISIGIVLFQILHAVKDLAGTHPRKSDPAKSRLVADLALPAAIGRQRLAGVHNNRCGVAGSRDIGA